jgi:hypothetical protein
MNPASSMKNARNARTDIYWISPPRRLFPAHASSNKVDIFVVDHSENISNLPIYSFFTIAKYPARNKIVGLERR